MLKPSPHRLPKPIDQRKAAAAELRRRNLRATHPGLPKQAWSSLGSGYSSQGVVATREWLRSIESLAQALATR
jgi:hypothetical protein